MPAELLIWWFGGLGVGLLVLLIGHAKNKEWWIAIGGGLVGLGGMGFLVWAMLSVVGFGIG